MQAHSRLLSQAQRPDAPERPLASLILTLRDQRVILDADLARLYGVERRALNQAMKRKQNRFPADFIFDLPREEILRISQTVTFLRRLRISKQVRAFTEAGAGRRERTAQQVLDRERLKFLKKIHSNYLNQSTFESRAGRKSGKSGGDRPRASRSGRSKADSPNVLRKQVFLAACDG